MLERLCDQFIEVLPLLPIVVDDLGEAVAEVVAVAGEVQPVLTGELRKNPGLVLYGIRMHNY